MKPNLQEIRAELRRCQTYIDRAGEKRREIPDELYEKIRAANYCPNCSTYADERRLRPLKHEPETYHTNAVDVCQNCEEVYLAENEYEWGEIATVSDADPGL